MRRQAARYSLVHPVELSVASVRHAAMLEDLSRTGMFVRMATPLPAGLSVKVAMPGPSGSRLYTCGLVVRSVSDVRRSGVGLALREPCEPADDLFGLGVEHLMRRAAASRSAPVMQGDLTEIGLSSLLTMLEYERKTCRLVIHARRNIWIDLVEGRIVDAGSSSGSADAWTTMMEALDVVEGRFELYRATPNAATLGLLPITHLLLEHARRSDENLQRALA